MSRRMVTPVLLTAAVALGLAAIHLVRTPVDTRPIDGQAEVATGPEENAASQALRLRLDGTTPVAFKETVVRPLFWSSRRPETARAAQPPPRPKQVAVAPPPEPPAVEFRLAGIVHDGANVRRALIASPQAPEGRWVEVGAQIEGWRLTGIEPRAVRLEAAGRSRELKLP